MISIGGTLINCQILLITSFSCESQGEIVITFAVCGGLALCTCHWLDYYGVAFSIELLEVLWDLGVTKFC